MKRLPKSAYIAIGVVILLSPIFSAFSGTSPEPTPTSSQSQTPRPTQTQTSEPIPTESATVSEEPTEPASTEKPSEPAETSEPVAQETERPQNPLATLLSQLTLAPERGDGYDRDLFRHWVDDDGDGCNARREVLIAEAVNRPQVSGDCDLVGGSWYSVYDGVTTTDPSDFDIDHVVALKEAWDSGAYAWTASQRRAFANDLANPEALIAVSASSNRSKSDKDPADWLPPNQSYHCTYIEHWMKVKIFWKLSVDEREFQAIRRVSAGC
jgi:hypothetical protein